ncbi:hypothetical protein SLS62_011032 [Diatrype stigma]|uniref:Wax synthase domain-containing protein n=1 Tax=Diatrype stigma TaxID=117547 RepID=A0AAN9U7S6_9PEZI
MDASRFCLIAAWGTIWNFTLLVWTKPQWDAKRVDMRRKQRGNGTPYRNGAFNSREITRRDEPQGDSDAGLETHSRTSRGSFAQRGRITAHDGQQNGHTSAQRREQKVNGVLSGLREGNLASKQLSNTSDTSVEMQPGEVPAFAADTYTEQEFEYYWQSYPEDGPFLARLDWAFDIVSTFRMTAEGVQLPLESLPNRSREGYTRTLSRRVFFFERFFFDIVPSYIVLDLCAVLMMRDPYFIVGPEKSRDWPLSPPLSQPQALPLLAHPLLLSLRRTALSFVGILAALQLAFGFGALCLCFLGSGSGSGRGGVLGFRAHPWHLPTAFGSFDQVLDRGLAGFWGAWWHQTFRFGFEAPGRWLLARRRQRGEKAGGKGKEEGKGSDPTTTDRLLATAFAFLQSGLIHAAGSYSTVAPETKWWQPPLFFALAGAGSALQQWLSRLLLSSLSSPPSRRARRCANLAFALAWLWATGWLLIDDFARCGLWLYEPVPVSLFRALGYGPAGDRRVWRYDADFLPRWHTGKHWWESGIAV